MASNKRLLGLTLLLAAQPLFAADLKVAIRSDFAGGNVTVLKNEGAAVHLAPDLRGGKPWFHWHFEAQASQPGTVTFTFAGSPMLAARGPAVSVDGGKTWAWLGEDAAFPRHDGFRFAFTETVRTARFAVAVPYLQSNLDEFLDEHKNNPHLTRAVLTKSKAGRPVELLRIGSPGPGVRSMLATARHHACEAPASYVLEGLLRQALSDTPAGREFRAKYVLFCVPFVDKDGVEQGDQGKNRAPHDHNRDYGDAPIYPEIKAIQELIARHDIRLALDLHSPYLRGDIHEAYHFLGLGLPHVKNNLKEWIAWIKEERPQTVMAPLDFLTDPKRPNATDRRINSHYLATRANSLFAATIEVPYAQSTAPCDPAVWRAYGSGLLRAWLRTEFLATADGVRGDADNAGLLELRGEFTKLYRGKAPEAEKLVQPLLDSATPSARRAEATNLTALLRLQQKRFPEALRHAEAAGKDEGATTLQIATSLVLRMQVLCADPKTTDGDIEDGLRQWSQASHPSNEHQAKVYEAVGDRFHKKMDYQRSLEFARKQFEVVPVYEKGKLLNRIAAIHDLRGKPEEGIEARKEAVRLLRTRLGAVPERSVFGAMMTSDLFDALTGIPSATIEELRAAAALVLNHDVVTAVRKDAVRRKLAELEKNGKP